MFKFMKIFKNSYIFIIIALFYIPLLVAAFYSFNASPKKGEMSIAFTPDSSGWRNLVGNLDIARGAFTSFFIATIVATVVVILSVLTVFGIWKAKNKTVKTYISGTLNIPLINPDVITGVSLAVAFSAMFGTLKFLDDGIERAIIGHIVMIIPFGITIMYPRSETFKISQFEASKDLGYGAFKTWWKTYFRHMLLIIGAVFVIALGLSFDDFIITKTTSRASTLGTQLYQTTRLRSWIFALGTIVLLITLSTSLIATGIVILKGKRG